MPSVPRPGRPHRPARPGRPRRTGGRRGRRPDPDRGAGRPRARRRPGPGVAARPRARTCRAGSSLVQGGSAATTARWLARLGARSSLIASVGRDRRRPGAGRGHPERRRDPARVARGRGTDRADRGARRPGRRAELRGRPRRGRPARAGRPAARPGSPARMRIHLPAYSLLAEPLGAAGRRAIDLARDADAAVSVDLASIGPLLAGGRRAAHGADRRGIAPTSCSRRPPRPRRSSAAAVVRGAARARPDGGHQARVEGRHGARPDSAANGFVSRWPPSRSPRRTRPGPGTRSTPASSSAGSRPGGRGAGCRPRSGARRWRATGRRARQLSTPRAELAAGLMITDRLTVSPDVATALREGRPVVALESTLISHGLPYPENLAVATALGGRGPGRRRDPGHRRGARRPAAGRPGRRRAPGARHRAAPGTVRKAARPEPRCGPRRRWVGGHDRVGDDDRGARGGDPGVRHRRDRGRPPRRARRVRRGDGRRRHRAVAPTFDISSDLEELGRTPMAVVCAGPKAILDVPATLEYLETRGVPVVAVGQAELPGFFARSAGVAAPDWVPDIAAAAGIVGAHLGLGARWRDPRLRAGPGGRGAGRRRGPRRGRASRRRGRRRRDRRSGPDAVAAGADRRADRRRVGARQHGR